MTWTVLDWAEIFTAVGTISLSVVTVWITIHQNRKAKSDKIENWKDSYLNSHYGYVMKEIGEIQNQIGSIDEPFGFERLYTLLNHWGIFDESLLIKDNNSLEVKQLNDENNIALRHIKSGYPVLDKKINEINKMEERYKDCIRKNLQNFIDSLYRECKSEFEDWTVKPNIYKPIENVLPRMVEPETTKENTPVIKKIDFTTLTDSLLESIIDGGSDIRAEKEAFGTKVDSFNISLALKKGNSLEFRRLSKVVATTQNYVVTDKELLKFRKIWINLNAELKKLKKIYEGRERIMSNYEELREHLTSDILNKYGAGYRIMGECDMCKLTKDAKEDEIRPYVN